MDGKKQDGVVLLLCEPRHAGLVGLIISGGVVNATPPDLLHLSLFIIDLAEIGIKFT